jgi:A/G-specific adenine glycosylase
MMDLGATLCTRNRPACSRCPLNTDCEAHLSGRETDFPGRKARRDKPQRTTWMLLAHCDQELYLERRPPAGIWGGLWSLPELSGEDGVADWLSQHLNAAACDLQAWPPLKHSFSHYDLDIHPLEVRIRRSSSTVTDRAGIWFPLKNSPPLGFAAPVRKLVDALSEKGRH